jgi:hypothetical protein
VVSFLAGWGGLAFAAHGEYGITGGDGAKTATTGSVAAPASCAAQVQAWVNGGAVQRIDAFSGDLDSFAAVAQAFASDAGNGGASANDVSGIQSAAAAIQSDAQGVEASPGPSCVPGLRANLAAAAGDYSKAATDADNGMGEYTAGNIEAAATDIDVASSTLGRGNAKLALADTAVTKYKKGSDG